MSRELTEAFNAYFEQRARQAGAITPGQKLELVATLREETKTAGRVPLANGSVVRVDVKSPAVKAILEGKNVSIGGQKAMSGKGGGASVGLAGQSNGVKVAILAGIFLVPLILIGLVLAFRGGDEDEATATAVAVESTFTSTPTETATPTATTSPTPSNTPTIPPTLLPPPIPIDTPTPVSVALPVGNVGNNGNDLASLELAGFAYILSVGRVSNGVWEPEGAEWLPSLELRRVVAVPYDPEVLEAIFSLRPGDQILTRLRSGDVAAYTLSSVERLPRNQIEILAKREPSIAIVLYGEPGSNDRWVVLGTAVQETADFASYTPLIPDTPTLTAPSFQTVITSSQVITTPAGILSVSECQEQDEIDDRVPPGSEQRFVVCSVSLTITAPGSTGSWHITEQSWAESATWLPPLLSFDGQLHPETAVMGTTVTGLLAGLVNNQAESVPVLVWVQTENATQTTRYIVYLQIEE